MNDVTIWLIRVECWTSKAIGKHAHVHAHAHAPTHTHARARADKYVIFIAFTLQQ